MPVEYVAFAVWCFLVAFGGGLVGLVLGNLRLPATLLIAASPAAATGANLIVSAAAAGAAAIAHIRAGRVNWRLFAWMAPPSIVAAVAGGYLSGVLPRGILLGFISAVLLYSGIDLWRWKPRPKGGPTDDPADLDVTAAVVAGGVIGLLGGIVGLILGSLRMPALIRFVGEVPHRAVGTNVTVGFCVGIAGALLGSRLTGRLSPEQLVRAIAVVLVVAAAATGAEAVLG